MNLRTKVAYKLVAKVIGVDARIEKTRVDLFLTQQLNSLIVPLSQEKVARISTWCCIDKGAVKIKMNVDKSAYSAGDTIAVSLNVDNWESLSQGTDYRVSLIRTIMLPGRHGRMITGTFLVSTASFSEKLASGQATASDNMKTIQLPIPTQDIEFLSTVSGRLFQCNYRVKGEILMDGCCMCCGDQTAVEKEVTIYPGKVAKQPMPTLAEMWKPIVRPKISAMLSKAEASRDDPANTTASSSLSLFPGRILCFC